MKVLHLYLGFGVTGNTGTSTSLFGQPQQPATTSLFGASSQPKSLFGTVTTTTTASPFGGLSNNTSLFGQTNAAKVLLIYYHQYSDIHDFSYYARIDYFVWLLCLFYWWKEYRKQLLQWQPGSLLRRRDSSPSGLSASSYSYYSDQCSCLSRVSCWLIRQHALLSSKDFHDNMHYCLVKTFMFINPIITLGVSAIYLGWCWH